MINEKDIRWKQRFQNFEKAYNTFDRILKIPNPNEAEKMGLIQAFEIVFELAWKTIKDYLMELGFDEKSPRDALKQAYQSGIITEGHTWMEALSNRNETVHTYDDKLAEEMDNKIREKYFPVISNLYFYLKKEYNSE
ncbi:MAG: HI0074 family nucleotidyltransferase substrate-binding subunit [bacterium]